MDGPRPTAGPGEQRPARRLQRPPSDRYGAAERLDGAAQRPDGTAQRPDQTAGERPRSARAHIAAIVAGLAGAVVIALGGGLLTMTAGLLVIAAVVGWVVAVALSIDAARGPGLGPRRWTAAGIALAAVALGQVGLWLIARGEGGTLGLVDYLAEVFGPLVPAQSIIASLVAWWRAS